VLFKASPLFVQSMNTFCELADQLPSENGKTLSPGKGRRPMVDKERAVFRCDCQEHERSYTFEIGD
jgi:hypothetical protein